MGLWIMDCEYWVHEYFEYKIRCTEYWSTNYLSTGTSTGGLKKCMGMLFTVPGTPVQYNGLIYIITHNTPYLS